MGNWATEADKRVPLHWARWSPRCEGPHAIRISVVIKRQKWFRIHSAGDEQNCGRFS